MPTIIEFRNYRIVIYTNDHMPPHVHCIGPGISARIEIKTRRVMSNDGIGAKDLRRLADLIEKYETVLMDEWNRIHD
jgi:hypothetical protein